MKSFRPKDGGGASPEPGRNGARNFRGERRSNETHTSTTDPDARLYRKARGQASKLCYMGHLLMENRNGLVVDTETTHATGTAEREAAEAMVGDLPGCGRITLGSDTAFDVAEHVANLREMNVTPHVAQNDTNRSSAIDGRTTRHPGYALSQRIRKRIEEAFGWIKVPGGLRKTRFRGLERVIPDPADRLSKADRPPLCAVIAVALINRIPYHLPSDAAAADTPGSGRHHVREGHR